MLIIFFNVGETTGGDVGSSARRVLAATESRGCRPTQRCTVEPPLARPTGELFQPDV